MGLLQVGCLVDLKRLPDLRGIRIADDGAIEIGALTTHREIERSPLVAGRDPEFASLERGVANVRVRATGTLGGNLAFAEPHSDPATFLIACGASVELVGPAGRRTLGLDAFIVGPLETAREPAEIVTTIRIPARTAGQGRAYERLALVERPTASVAVAATVRDGRIVAVTVVVGSVTALPTRLTSTGAGLVGRPTSELEDAIHDIRRDPPDPIDAFGDHTGSADYKRHLAWELFARALRRSVAMAVS
jgi:carbon-monoxide dehydrogenase medium subunit